MLVITEKIVCIFQKVGNIILYIKTKGIVLTFCWNDQGITQGTTLTRTANVVYINRYN